MSYDVQLFKKETKIRELKSDDEDFFEDESNLEPFTAAEKQELHERLLRYGYAIAGNADLQGNIEYENEDEGALALLTDRGLYFSTNSNPFEIGMTASEFTDNDAFVKYDPQNDGWEEIE